MSSLIVSKFGGSSMADFAAMTRSAKITLRQKTSIVLVSATYKTTDQLVSLVKDATLGDWSVCEKTLTEIRSKHFNITENLKVSDVINQQLDLLFQELETLAKGIFLLHECSPKIKDLILSFGERTSSLIFSQVLSELSEKRRVQLFDIRGILKTDSTFNKAVPNLEKIRECATNSLKCSDDLIYVGQGFIGSDENDFTTTLGRGGSDYSASLIAEAIDADRLEIWTDVPGIASTDPRICEKVKKIDEISFNEASEMAQYGAKVLHPTTLLPTMRKNIPVFVGSSFEEEMKGTWIRDKVESKPIVRAITKRSNQILLTLKTPKMVNAFGFMGKIFDIFSSHQISVDCVTTSEISVAITLDEGISSNRKLLKELEAVGEVNVEKNYSLISIIGNNIGQTVGVTNKILSSIPDVNIRMMCLGASEYNYNFLVKEVDAEKAIINIHRDFIENTSNGLQ